MEYCSSEVDDNEVNILKSEEMGWPVSISYFRITDRVG